MRETRKATLILEDGTTFEGKIFGYEASTSGEVVFNTAMTGYPENLTAPSNEGQILITTYPILGNYGAPPRGKKESLEELIEGGQIHAKAIITQDYSCEYSHWQAASSLEQWLLEEKIPGIYGIDTRALTKHLRENGTMLGKIVIEGDDNVEFYTPDSENLVGKVSHKEVEEYGAGEKTVVVVDCGTRYDIIKSMTKRGVKVVFVPWDYDFNTIPYDGLIISDGPGNPELAEATLNNLRKAMESEKPIFGIGIGNLMLSIAAGGTINKLKSGHRTHNQPVRLCGTNSCYITSQSHSYVVDASTLSADWEEWFINMNDGSNEGIRHKSKPFAAVQFSPDDSDTEFLLDEFVAKL